MTTKLPSGVTRYSFSDFTLGEYGTVWLHLNSLIYLTKLVAFVVSNKSMIMPLIPVRMAHYVPSFRQMLIR